MVDNLEGETKMKQIFTMLALVLLTTGCATGIVTVPNPGFDGDLDMDMSETEEVAVDGDSEVTENETTETEVETEESETELELPNPDLQGSCPEGQACMKILGLVAHKNICTTGVNTLPPVNPCQSNADCQSGSMCVQLPNSEIGYCAVDCTPSEKTECTPVYGKGFINDCCDRDGKWKPTDYEVSARRSCVQNFCGENHDGKTEIFQAEGTECNDGKGECDGKGFCCGGWGCG